MCLERKYSNVFFLFFFVNLLFILVKIQFGPRQAFAVNQLHIETFHQFVAQCNRRT